MKLRPCTDSRVRERRDDLWRRRAAHLRRRKRRFIVLGLGLMSLVSGLILCNVLNLRWPIPAPHSEITPSLAADDWATLQRDHLRTGYLPVDSPQLDGTILWQLHTEGTITSPPSVVDGTLYVGTGDARILALDGATGDVVWERGVSSPIDLPVTVAGDYLYVVLRNGHLLALDKSGGENRWRFTTSDIVLATPLVHKGVVYLSARDRILHAVDALTGESRWAYKLSAASLSSPAIAGNILALGTEDGNIHLLDSRNGTPRRVYPTGIAIWSAPVIVDGRVFITNNMGYARAIDLSPREILFEKPMRALWWQFYLWRIAPPPPRPRGAIWLFSRSGESFVGNMAVAHGMVYLGSGRRGSDGSVYALDQSTGKQIWEFRASAPISSSPSIVGEIVYIASDDGVVHVLNALTGKEVSRLAISGVVNGSPVYSNGTLYVTTQGGVIYAIR